VLSVNTTSGGSGNYLQICKFGQKYADANDAHKGKYIIIGAYFGRR